MSVARASRGSNAIECAPIIKEDFRLMVSEKPGKVHAWVEVCFSYFKVSTVTYIVDFASDCHFSLHGGRAN